MGSLASSSLTKGLVTPREFLRGRKSSLHRGTSLGVIFASNRRRCCFRRPERATQPVFNSSSNAIRIPSFTPLLGCVQRRSAQGCATVESGHPRRCFRDRIAAPVGCGLRGRLSGAASLSARGCPLAGENPNGTAQVALRCVQVSAPETSASRISAG